MKEAEVALGKYAPTVLRHRTRDLRRVAHCDALIFALFWTGLIVGPLGRSFDMRDRMSSMCDVCFATVALCLGSSSR